jgi:glycerol-3-phosphate dehydrogenase
METQREYRPLEGAAANPAAQRIRAIESLTGAPVQLLIVGGGIVGSGIARDAAMRGLRTGLVEQHDFAFGTSSRSSRLLHGGLRYLAQGRLGLVREASVEKKIIHQIAPHLSAPLPFIFPTYRGNRDWVLWQLKIGVKIYDLLCSGRNLGKSSWLDSRTVLQKVPILGGENLTGAVRYFDGFTNDSRLTLDTLRSAARSGALVLNYCRFKEAARTSAGDGSKPLWDCVLHDELSGIEFKVRAQAVANATGPWADGLPHSRVKLRITKGIHVVVDRARLPVPETVVMTEGKRILFAIPWGERTILGTTDTDYDGSLDEVRVEQSDIDYVFAVANRAFPKARLTSADLISAWAGLRPLIADPSGKPSDISRSHQIRNPEPGWWDIAGGKLTTYRLMAEQTVDQIVSWLGGSHELNGSIQPCRTAQEPLLPSAETDNISGILPPRFSRTAVEHYCANEWAMHLDDVMIRRTGWGHYSTDAAQMAERVADWMGELFGWSGAERTAEVVRYQRAIGIGAHAATGNGREPSTPQRNPALRST